MDKIDTSAGAVAKALAPRKRIYAAIVEAGLSMPTDWRDDIALIEALSRDLEAMRAERDALQARVAELEAALDQFPEDWRERADGMRGPFKMQKAWSDGFNAARAALTKEPKP